MDRLKYKGYTGSVEYSEEDECLYGHVLGMSGNRITYEGASVQELKRDFEAAIDFYLDCCRERGAEPLKPYSGKLMVRMPSELHERVANLAMTAGTTINEIVKRAVLKEVNQFELN